MYRIGYWWFFFSQKIKNTFVLIHFPYQDKIINFFPLNKTLKIIL